MAKMHSRKKGTSGSKRPLKATKPSWVRYKPKEAELLVTKLAKEGKSQSEIGLHLRDSYGVPSIKILTGKRIGELLTEKHLGSELPEDLMALLKRTIVLRKHLEINKKDMKANRGLQLAEARINRLAKYYRRVERIPMAWKYRPDSIRITSA